MSGIKKASYVIPIVVLLFVPYFMGVGMQTGKQEVNYQKTADMLYTVLQANRNVYAKYVIERLTNEQGVIKASEHWVADNALPLPAQMVQLSSIELKDSNAELNYSLQSLWAVNKKNFPKTEKERDGLIYVLNNPGKNYYSNIELNGKKYFMAVYPDNAISPACVQCHNNHQNSPKKDFQVGDLMGGLVLRIPLS